METELAHEDVPGEQAEAEGSAEEAMTGGPRVSEASLDSVDHILSEVEEALSRLDDGSYGRCEACGVSIDDDRLVQDPTIRVCADCPPTGAAAAEAAGPAINVGVAVQSLPVRLA